MKKKIDKTNNSAKKSEEEKTQTKNTHTKITQKIK